MLGRTTFVLLLCLGHMGNLTGVVPDLLRTTKVKFLLRYINRVTVSCFFEDLCLSSSGTMSFKAHGVGRVVGALGSEAGFAGSMLN